MPSLKDPNLVVNPGPGLLPAGVVPASALLFIPGGGANAALQAHINNPHDAHMAHAIGIDPYYPWGTTQQPLISAVGGPIDGESVLDFIDEVKDLLPPRPNAIGFSAAAGVTTGVPNWDTLNAQTLGGQGYTGGYAQGSNVQFSHYIVQTFVSTFAPTGLLYPADRGVLAFYKNTSGNFLDAANTTLVAALSLNVVAPSGIPGAAFNEVTRNTGQTNYTGSGTGLDLFSLTFRLPYLTAYGGGVPYGPFSANFFRYQLAEWALTAQAVGAGDAQSFLLVHWRETYATTLAAIQPANLTLPHLVTANCYSAVPTSNTAYASGSWDDNTIAAFNVNRHFIFKDTNSAASPAGSVFTSSPNGGTTGFLSGINYYTVGTGGGALTWTVDIRATGLFANSFQTGSTDNPPNVPAQMHSAFEPIQMDFTGFGGGVLAVPYYSMNKFGGGAYSAANTPATGDTGEYQNGSLAILTPTSFCPVGGYAQLGARLRNTFHETTFVDTNKYLYNTYSAGALPTTTFEPFVDEYFRYITTFDPTPSATVPMLPAGGNIFPSSTPFVVTGPNLQVAGELIYPQTNYNVGTFHPTQATDYSGFPGGDGANHPRRFQRAVDTSLPRNTGWLRLRGLAQAAFKTNAAFDGNETTGHTTGGAIIQLKVPGASGTGWLDLGRAYGDPGLTAADFYGCATGVIVDGSDVYVSFNTTAMTSNNGTGNFLLFVRVTFLNGAGTSLTLAQFQWYPPTFTPP